MSYTSYLIPLVIRKDKVTTFHLEVGKGSTGHPVLAAGDEKTRGYQLSGKLCEELWRAVEMAASRWDGRNGKDGQEQVMVRRWRPGSPHSMLVGGLQGPAL